MILVVGPRTAAADGTGYAVHGKGVVGADPVQAVDVAQGPFGQ